MHHMETNILIAIAEVEFGPTVDPGNGWLMKQQTHITMSDWYKVNTQFTKIIQS